MKTINRAFYSMRIVFKYALCWSFVYIAVMAVSALLTPARLYLIETLVDSLGSNNNGGLIALYIVLILLSIVMNNLFSLANGFIRAKMNEAMLKNQLPITLKKFRRIDYCCFENRVNQDMLQKISENPTSSALQVFYTLASVLYAWISTIGILVMFFRATFILGIVSIATMIPMFIFESLSVVVFISLSAFMSMAFDEADREIERTEYNISVSATYADSEEYQKLLDTVSFDYVQDFSVIRTAEIEFIGNHYNKEYSEWLQLMPDENDPQYISVASVGDKQFAKYCASLGFDPEKMENKAILCDYTTVKKYDESSNKTDNKYMRVFDFKNGDTVIGLTENALTENKINAQVEIAAVSENKPFGLKNWSSPFLFVSDETFNGMAETTYVNIYYKTDNSDKLQDEIESHLQGISFNLNNIDERFRQMNNLFTLVGIFLYGFIIVISLIGITNIFNTITTNMELRKPEFAMLRSVGMTNREFNRMIRLESLFMGTRSLLFGVPIGILLSYVIYHFLVGESGYPFELPTLSILIAVAAVFVLISLIMAYSMGKIKKQNTIETIRNENI